MSADQHRRDAKNNLDRAYGEDLEYAANLVAIANASALLAIEARLGELVDIQRAALARQTVGSVEVDSTLWEIADSLVAKAFGLPIEGGAS